MAGQDPERRVGEVDKTSSVGVYDSDTGEEHDSTIRVYDRPTGVARGMSPVMMIIALLIVLALAFAVFNWVL